MHGRHTCDNGEEVRLGSTPIEAGRIVVCEMGVSDEQYCWSRDVTYMSDSEYGQT
jgi:hypothetical protein